MLLNDTLLNEDRFKNRLSESPVCDCKERETVSHFLLRCPHYEEIRNKLQNVVDDISLLRSVKSLATVRQSFSCCF